MHPALAKRCSGDSWHTQAKQQSEFDCQPSLPACPVVKADQVHRILLT